MRIYGADFSGSRTPVIHIGCGQIFEGQFKVMDIIPCDDRADLLGAICHYTGCWGLDFPFSVPAQTLTRFGCRTWSDLGGLLKYLERDRFYEWLDELKLSQETRCTEPSELCRQTDCELRAFSGFKKYNPSMRGMSYSGMKLLHHLHNAGVGIYPFTEPTRSFSSVCEVYPSHTWAKVGMKRSTNLREFVDRFNDLEEFIDVIMPHQYDEVETQDIADSIVACITTAAVQYRDNIHGTWGSKPSFATDAEWEVAKEEGLIVRI